MFEGVFDRVCLCVFARGVDWACLIKLGHHLHCLIPLTDFPTPFPICARRFCVWCVCVVFLLLLVVTRWKLYRSSTSMQFSDFQKLDLIVRRELLREPDLLSRLPGRVVFSAIYLSYHHTNISSQHSLVTHLFDVVTSHPCTHQICLESRVKLSI